MRIRRQPQSVGIFDCEGEEGEVTYAFCLLAHDMSGGAMRWYEHSERGLYWLLWVLSQSEKWFHVVGWKINLNDGVNVCFVGLFLDLCKLRTERKHGRESSKSFLPIKRHGNINSLFAVSRVDRDANGPLVKTPIKIDEGLGTESDLQTWLAWWYEDVFLVVILTPCVPKCRRQSKNWW